MKTLLKLSLGLLLPFFLASCITDGSTGGGSGTVSMDLNFGLKQEAFLTKTSRWNGVSDTLILTDAGGIVFTLHEARINVRHIELDRLDSTAIDSTETVTFEGPYVFDLLRQTATPEWVPVEIPEGLYKRMDIRVDDAETVDGLLMEGDPLLGNSIYVSGLFSYEERDDRQFEISFQFNEDIRFENDEGVSLSREFSRQLQAYLVVQDWFTGTNIAACLMNGDMELDTAGNLSINDDNARGQCAEVENHIKTNMKNSGLLQ